MFYDFFLSFRNKRARHFGNKRERNYQNASEFGACVCTCVARFWFRSPEKLKKKSDAEGGNPPPAPTPAFPYLPFFGK